MKFIVIGFLLPLFFIGCTNNKNVSSPANVANEVSSKKIFSENDNWSPINKNTDFQNAKNDKVVK